MAGEGACSSQLILPVGDAAWRGHQWLLPRACAFFSLPPTTTKGVWSCQQGNHQEPPTEKFILQEHPVKWLMDSMRHKAGVKGAGGNKRERCVKGERTGPGKELGSAVSRPSSGLCCSPKQAGTALVVGLFQRLAAVCIQRGN